MDLFLKSQKRDWINYLHSHKLVKCQLNTNIILLLHNAVAFEVVDLKRGQTKSPLGKKLLRDINNSYFLLGFTLPSLEDDQSTFGIFIAFMQNQFLNARP